MIFPRRSQGGCYFANLLKQNRKNRVLLSEVSSPELTMMDIDIEPAADMSLFSSPPSCSSSHSVFFYHSYIATPQTATKCEKCVDKSTLINSLVNKLSLQVKLMSKILGDSLVLYGYQGNRSEITYQRYSSKQDIASVVSL